MIYFVTTNSHKFRQARKILKEYGINIGRINKKYDEASDDTVREIVEKASRKLAKDLKSWVFVEDTGVFFKAYPGFPGSLPKFVFNGIGYDGVFRLLRGKSRQARWVSCVSFCEPGKRPKVFTGEMRGRIAMKVHCRSRDVLPYERIFVPEGYDRVLASWRLEEKLKVLHRAKALRKLGAYLNKRFKFAGSLH